MNNDERFERLEKKIRNQRIVMFVLVVCAVGIGWQGNAGVNRPPKHKVLMAERLIANELTIVNDKGETVGEFVSADNVTEFNMSSPTNSTENLIELSASDGSPGLWLNDSKGRRRFSINVYQPKSSDWWTRMTYWGPHKSKEEKLDDIPQ